jgi:DNA-directed RNA polymerase subunit N (RpoN/RPB10)
MSLLGKIGRLFTARPQRSDSTFHHFTVRCLRCGELIEAKINVYNDVSAEFGSDGKATYHCRKVLIGAGRCYQQIEVTFELDEGRRVLEQSVSGGEFVESK